MSNASISWAGQFTPDELAARLKAHPFAAVREPLMQKIVFIGLRHSQPNTPVRTGTLRRSETTRVEPGGLRGYLGSNLIYAPFVHRIVPFFEMGLEQGRGEIDHALQDAGDDYFKDLL
jgi:hypothetical protein